jgi:hypothetical protein
VAIYRSEEFKTKTGRLVTIRHCEASDIDAFLAFQPQAASETNHTLQVAGRVPERTKIEAAWKISIDDDLALRIGAFAEGRMIAQLGLHPESHLVTLGLSTPGALA